MLLTYNATYNATDNISPNYENAEDVKLHFHEKGEEITLTKQGLWQVYSGMVQLSMLNPTGKEVHLGWAQPSTFFGRWLSSTETYRAKALSDLYLRWYALKEIESSPTLLRAVLAQMVRRMRQTETMLSIATMRRVEDRLQHLLLLLKQEMGEAVPEGTKLKVRLTHQNMANAIGTTRVTVTRLIGDFQRQGLITIDGDRQIIVLNTGNSAG